MAARPRPRPRLVSARPAESETTVDEDDLFRRNKGRTAEDWRQLEQSAAKAVPFTVPDDDWHLDDPGDEDASLPWFRKKKKKPTKPSVPPRWQETGAKRILASDDEGDVQIIDHTRTDPYENPSPGKRKRERSRSKSITPPPKLPAHQRVQAMNIVRQALAVQPRPPSPTFLDDPADVIDLDPELAKIAEAVKQQVNRAHIDPDRAGGPESVNIKIRWRSHPLNPSAQEQSWTFEMKRHDTFRELFDTVADLAGVMANQLVMNHDHGRVFASGTPHSLHIWAEAELEACDKHTDEYIRLQRSNHASSLSPDSSPRSTVSQSDAESESESTGGDTIKLVLRSATTKDRTFPLTVRSTTTCGAIVKAFLKAAGLPDNYSHPASGAGRRPASFPQLVVDGDKMEFAAEIGDADLEDGDLVEIVGV